MSTPQEQFWAGDFGNSYTERNRVNWLDRVPFWTRIVGFTGAQSVLEVGCNCGWNLLAIRTANPGAYLKGIDVNEQALAQAERFGLVTEKTTAPAMVNGYTFDLVFTAGCLIHVSPESLPETMRAIKSLSSRYVLAVEYEADNDEEIDYRGHAERLWKRPYGKLYEEMGLKLIDSGDAGEGFDRCTFWLLEKP